MSDGVVRVGGGVTEVKTRRKVAATEVKNDSIATVRAGLSLAPQNFEQAMIDDGIFAAGEMIPAGLVLELWTDKGSQSVVLEEEEEITMAVRVTQPAYLQLVYHLATECGFSCTMTCILTPQK